jgi:heme A synthase
MPKWAAIITGMAIITGITGITVTTADGFHSRGSFPIARRGDGCRPACADGAGRHFLDNKMRIPFYPRTF